MTLQRGARGTLLALLGALLLPAVPVHAQKGEPGQTPVTRGIPANRDIGVNIWIPDGSVRVVGWDRDSLHVQGTIAAGRRLMFGGSRTGAKVGVDDESPGGVANPAHITAYVPRGARVNVRTASASIVVNGASGWFNTVSGNVSVSGTVDDLQVETIDGSIDITSQSPRVRARTGSGALTLSGRAEDVVASTVSGALTVTANGLTRGRFESVTGAIDFAGAIDRASAIDVDNHSGSVELRLPPSAAATFDLTSVAGSITNLFDKRAPVAGRQGRGQELAFITDAKGARIVVRTFKGPITLTVLKARTTLPRFLPIE